MVAIFITANIRLHSFRIHAKNKCPNYFLVTLRGGMVSCGDEKELLLLDEGGIWWEWNYMLLLYKFCSDIA